MPEASADQAAVNSGRSPASFVTNEEVTFSSQNDPLHLALADVVVDGHGAALGGGAQFLPLPKDPSHRLGDGVLGEQLQRPVGELAVQCRARAGTVPASGTGDRLG